MKGGKREMWGVGKIERGQKGDVRHMNVVLCVRLWLESMDVGFLDEVLPAWISIEQDVSAGIFLQVVE